MQPTPMSRVILDMRGLLIRSMKSGQDPDAVLAQDGTRFPTAAYGVITFVERYLQPILNNVNPLQLVCVWDSGNDYRKNLWADYKKRRSQSKEDMDPVEAEQYDMLMKLGKSLMSGLGCIQVQCPGQEADDVIALITQSIPAFQMIYTVDSDLLALARDDVMVHLPDGIVADGHLSPADAEHPIPPHLITLFKSICGDPTDQYPGMPGMGIQKWNHLVREYGFDGMEELDSCVRNHTYGLLEDAIAETGDKWLTALYDGRNHWELMYELAKLHPELCTGVHGNKIVNLKWGKRRPSRERVEKVLRHCHADSLMQDVFEEWMPTMTLCTDSNLDEVLEFMNYHLPLSPAVSFDYETMDTLKHEDFKAAANGRDVVDALSSVPIGASFTFGNALQHTVYFTTGHADSDNTSNDVIKAVLEECALSLGKPMIAHNAPFEHAVTKNALELDIGEIVCTRQMYALVDENTPKDLKFLSKRFLGEDPTTFKALLEACGVSYIEETTAEQALVYGCDDAANAGHLWHLFDLILILEGTWERFYTRLVKASRPVVDGFLAGALIDKEELEVQARKDEVLIEQGTAKIRQLLEEHCSEIKPENAKQLVEDDTEYLTMKLTDANKSPEEIQDKLKEAASDRYNGTQYVPLKVTRKGKEFVPTPKQISEVCQHLGIQTEFASVAVSRVNLFLAAAYEEELSEEARGFLDLMAEASDQIRKREGEDYEVFRETCQIIMDGQSPAVTTGTELNFGSPKQMQNLFYGMLGLPIRIRTIPQKGSFRSRMAMKGAPSVSDMAVNAAMAEDCAEGDWRTEVLLTYLSVKHAKTRTSLYWKPYPLWVHPRDGRIHPNISLLTTVTHRPTGSNPNPLQVAKGPVRRVIRGHEEDHVIISPDFNGQELRIVTSESKDPALLDVYNGPVKKDPHTMTSCFFGPAVLARINPKALMRMSVDAANRFTYGDFEAYRKMGDDLIAPAAEKVRKMAKVVNFLTSYMGTPPTLALKLWVPVDFAEVIQDYLFKGYVRIQPWQQEVIEVARRQGYVENAYGVRRHLNNGIFSKDNSIRRRLERQAVNFMIQGCAAQILEDVLAETEDRDFFQRYRANLFAPVYDEFAVSVPVSQAIEASLELCEIMRITPPGHAVSMVPELTIGRSWGTMVELGPDFDSDSIAAGIEESYKLDEKAKKELVEARNELDEYEVIQSPDMEEREALLEEAMEAL